uniref:E3 ubiquitin-protein ligase CBL n=1 Tax=Mesocestoides corti TaxID=53468 RepID=A0A5K3ERN5_MESCO
MRPKLHNSHSSPFPTHDHLSSSSAHPILLKADKKVIDSVNKRIDKLVHLCQHPRIQLRNSPPYLLDILPDISEKLKAIVNNYQGALEELFNTLYFQVFLRNLIEKCKLTSRLFKEAKELMYDERSEYRRRLIKYSLVFSHILKDLEALYPNNHFSPASFRITKKEAAEWWYKNFDRSPIIPWEMFREALFQSFEVTDPSHMRELQSTIDLTCNDFVSVFEFDVFVRLFQPWNNVIETWKALAIMHAGYMAFMTYDEVKAVLKKFRSHPGPGSYVYRLSCTKLGQWAIGYITHDLHILQTIIQNKSLAQALIDGERDGFYLYPNGTPSQSSILMPLVRNLPRAHVKVSQEQHDLYYLIGSTFELCKICTENNKNVRLEPCNHLLCKSCLHNCLGAANGQKCPFCRMEVKSIEDIVLDPFVSPHNSIDEDNDVEHTVFPISEGGEEAGEVDEEPHFQDRAIETVPAPGAYASTSTGVNLDTSSTGTAASEEDVVASSRRRRNPSSCCSRITDPDLQTREGQSAITMDPVAFMQRSDVAQVLGGPPLTTDVAKQLLETCDGNADIAARVWRYFMPRP